MKSLEQLARRNLREAKRTWGHLASATVASLLDFTRQYRLSVARGELIVLESRLYLTHSGLLAVARRSRCHGIVTKLERGFCDPSANRWVFKATVYKTARSRGFVGYGDADPSNVSPLVRGAELRVAETRAVNRALRKAYGIGLCSVEELGWSAGTFERTVETKKATSSGQNGSSNGQPRLRDRLCQLIRQYQLDPALVKRYAAEFCGTEALRDASRELVESFIQNLAEWAAKDRDGLVCHLNSYSQSQEVHT